jgi:hypothetical protein
MSSSLVSFCHLSEVLRAETSYSQLIPVGVYKPDDPMIRLKESGFYVGYDHGGEPYIVPGGPVQKCPSASGRIS